MFILKEYKEPKDILEKLLREGERTNMEIRRYTGKSRSFF